MIKIIGSMYEYQVHIASITQQSTKYKKKFTHTFFLYCFDICLIDIT